MSHTIATTTVGLSLRCANVTTMQAASWQMNVSAKLGVPEHLCNTYDILGPTKLVLPCDK